MFVMDVICHTIVLAVLAFFFYLAVRFLVLRTRRKRMTVVEKHRWHLRNLK